MTYLAKADQLYLDAHAGSTRMANLPQMGEKPMPVEDEVERALASMRAGFLSGAGKISAGLASLQEHLAEASVEEREALSAAVTQIFSAQARLNARIESLPAPSWERFTAMVGLLKAQETVLDQLDRVLKEHVLPRQLDVEDASLAAEPPPRVFAPTPKSEGLLAAHEALEALRAEEVRQAHDIRRARHARRGRGNVSFEDDEPRSLLSLAREWTSGFRGVAAMIVAAVLLSLVPRDIKLQDLATKLTRMVGGAEREAAPSGALGTTPEVSPPAEAKAPTPGLGTVPDRPRPSPTAPPDQRRATGPAAALPDVGAVTDRTDRPAPTEPEDKRLAARAAIDEPTAPPASIPEEQFVPVVFTHKDYATVMQALADLKQQYPSLLVGRKGAVQPVDLGKKGIWHRLVFLPAGPRPEASKLCDQLMAEGYDRCWVKAY